MTEVTQHNELYPTGLPMSAGGVAVLSQFPHTEQDTLDPNRDIRDVDDLRPDIGRDPDNAAVIAEEDVVVGALERVRFFVQKKQEQLTEKMQHSPLTRHAKRLGAIAATSVALLGIQASPVGEKIAEKAPVPTIAGDALKTPEAKAEVFYDPATNSDFWLRDKETPLAGTDTYDAASNFDRAKNIGLFECAAYANFKVLENGTPNGRVLGLIGKKALRQMGEIISNTPAAGAVAIDEGASKNGHAVYVEEVLPSGKLNLSEYNGHRPHNYFRWQMPQSTANQRYDYYIRYDLPNPKLDRETVDIRKNYTKYMGAAYDRKSKNTITPRRNIKSDTFIRSKDRKFALVVQNGKITSYSVENGDSVWSIKTSKKANQLGIKLGKGKQRGKNKLVFSDGKKVYKSWYIGRARKLTLNSGSGFAGHAANNKKVLYWADSPRGLPYAAKYAEKQLVRKRKIMRKTKNLKKHN